MDKKEQLSAIVEIQQIFKRFIFFEEPLFYDFFIIYVFFTYLYDIFDQIPYLSITGPWGSGKSRLTDILKGLSFNSISSSNISNAAVYRIFHLALKGTLIMDEQEHLSSNGRKDFLLRILRSGYRKINSEVYLCVSNNRVESFQTYFPKILVNEGGLTDAALQSRCINIHMARARSETERFRLAKVMPEIEKIKYRIECIAKGMRDATSDLYENFPSIDGLSKREEEIWMPIIVIADVLDNSISKPIYKERMTALAIRLSRERAQQRLLGNRDAQILEGTDAFLHEKNESSQNSVCIAADLTAFIRERWDLPNLRIEWVSRILNKHKILNLDHKHSRRIRIKDTQRVVQRVCLNINTFKLAEVLQHDVAGGERDESRR